MAGKLIVVGAENLSPPPPVYGVIRGAPYRREFQDPTIMSGILSRSLKVPEED
jgi:hypothetical protein